MGEEGRQAGSGRVCGKIRKEGRLLQAWLQRLPSGVAMEEPWSLWLPSVLDLQNRLPFSGHTLFSAYLDQPQTVFQESVEKQTRTGLAWPIFLLPLTKSMFWPLHLPGGWKNRLANTEAALNRAWATVLCKLSNTCRAFSPLWIRCVLEALMCVFFFFILPLCWWGIFYPCTIPAQEEVLSR